MRDKKTGIAVLLTVFALSFVFGMTLLGGLLQWYEACFYDKAAAIVSALPEEQLAVMQALKASDVDELETGRAILQRYGYRGRLLDGGRQIKTAGLVILAACLTAGAVWIILNIQDKMERHRLDGLTNFLRQVEQGIYPILSRGGEDCFSVLEDEIYKTVAELRESRENALQEREYLARNLADISHQLKTPLTSISLTTEVLEERLKSRGDTELSGVERIASQTERLAGLVESLLTLSRLDAEALTLQLRQVPAEELIYSAAEPVRAVMEARGQRLSVNAQECEIVCDLGWTAEALGNILKNCSEHAPRDTEISIRVRQNPIFSEMVVEDQGNGFDNNDLSHIFERFYKGKNSDKSSVGIGLALAKGIVERQNGSIFAENRKKGGARFVIKFYKNK